MSQPTVRSTNQTRVHHKKRLVITVSAVFVALVIVATAVLGYAGFLPGVTEAMDTNKPVDLGVTYSAADFNRLGDTNAFGLVVDNYDHNPGLSENVTSIAPGSKLVVFGGRTNQATLTQEELTAFVNLLPWTNAPLTNAQLRLNNGSFEFSGNVKSQYVSSLIKAVYPSGNYGQLSPLVKLASHLDNPAVYAKMSVSVENTSDGPSHGLLRLKVLALKVNRTDLSKDVSAMQPLELKVGEASWAQGLGFSLGSLSVSNGQLNVYGTLPSGFAVGDGNPGAICKNYHGGELVSLSPVKGHIGSGLTHCQ